MPEMIILAMDEKMEKCLESLKREFQTIRTGKANPAMLNNVEVSYYGVMTPLNQTGSITCPDPQSIVVKPWDRSLVKEIGKAIQMANLGLNPLVEADLVRIPIPPLNEQVRRDLAKQAKKVTEDNKVAIRNVRRDAVDQLKKMEKDSLISEDALKGYLDDVQKDTDKYCDEADALYKVKESDIMSI